MWQLWLVFWQQSVSPFEVILKTHAVTAEPHTWADPQKLQNPNGAGKGDGMTWTIDLGQPFLQLTSECLNDPGFRQKATAVLRTWIIHDRLTLMRYHQFIPVLTGITKWNVNSPDILEARTWQFWDSRPGVNIARLCQTVSPMLVNLGAHLQWQDDSTAYLLIPILEWLDAKGSLDDMGKGLLDGLRGTQARGVGPADIIPESHRQKK